MVEVSATSDVTISDDDWGSLLHDLRGLLNPVWLPDVLVALSAGPRPYTGLLQSIRTAGTPRSRRWPRPIIRDAVLYRTLRWMEQRGLVAHTRERQFPFSASYRLTAAAQELLALSVPLAEWAARHEDLLELDRRARAQARARRTNTPA